MASDRRPVTARSGLKLFLCLMCYRSTFSFLAKVTLGAKKLSTSERKEMRDSRRSETSTSASVELAGAHAAAKLGFQATTGKTEKVLHY